MTLARRIVSTAAALTAGLILAAPAHSALILSLSDGTDTVTTIDLDEDGAVLFVGQIGDWVLNVTVGVADAFGDGDTQKSRLDLGSLNVTGSSENGGTLVISITDTGNTVPIGETGFSLNLGGTTDGTVSFESYVDSTNTAFGTDTLIHESGLLGDGAFAASGTGSVTVSGPYAITTIVRINHEDGKSVTGFIHGVEIQEPAGLALFAIGLLGLAVGIRKASRKP